MTEPSVRLEGVTKRFDEFEAVKSMDLDIAQGEFFTMLGPSGCGKTTTLRMIAGFEQPTEGDVRIEGTDVAGLPPHKRPTNTVFQSYALFPHMTVADNVGYGLKRQKVPKAEIGSRVEAELERVGLAERANQKPAQLSGGMQQRVALARALVNLPKVLLLDEPLGALDLKLRKGLQLELKGIQRDVGITFVYVTHDQEEALTMSDRIAVMNQGRVEQVDTPEEIYERPATTFVAGFIGVSNLMPGEVVSANGARPAGPPRRRGRDRGADERARPRRALPRGRPAGEASPRPPRRLGPGRLAERRGHGRELDLSRDRDPDRGQARRGRPDDGPGPERGRGRARTAARGRSTGPTVMGAGAHPRSQGVGGTGSRAKPRRRLRRCWSS